MPYHPLVSDGLGFCQHATCIEVILFYLHSVNDSNAVLIYIQKFFFLKYM